MGIEIETGISNSALGTYPATLPYISKGGASIWSRHKAPGPVEMSRKNSRVLPHNLRVLSGRNKSNFYPGKFTRECIALKEILTVKLASVNSRVLLIIFTTLGYFFISTDKKY